MQYDEPNLIKIAGQGRKGIEIYEEYRVFLIYSGSSRVVEK